MKTVKYHLSDPETWYEVLAKNALGIKKDNLFLFNSFLGDGQLEYILLQPGLWAQQMNVKFKEPLTLQVLPRETNDFFIISFYLSNAQIKQKTEDKLYQFAFDNVGILLSSSATSSSYSIPVQEVIKVFQIGMTRDWLMANAFDENNQTIKPLFEKNQAFHFSENLDYKFKYLVGDLDLKKTYKLSVFSSILQLLDYFFSNLQKRNFDDISTANIHSFDFEQLMRVRAYLDNNPLEEVSIEQLAQIAGMSLSKFKRLFKQVFGLTPYRYYLQNKMEIAMGILQKEDYSVSETGFIVGYSNLSQFSKAFKNHFGQLPSEVRA